MGEARSDKNFSLLTKLYDGLFFMGFTTIFLSGALDISSPESNEVRRGLVLPKVLGDNTNYH